MEPVINKKMSKSYRVKALPSGVSNVKPTFIRYIKSQNFWHTTTVPSYIWDGTDKCAQIFIIILYTFSLSICFSLSIWFSFSSLIYVVSLFPRSFSNANANSMSPSKTKPKNSLKITQKQNCRSILPLIQLLLWTNTICQ